MELTHADAAVPRTAIVQGIGQDAGLNREYDERLSR